jgi:hypothetical protein
MATKKSAAAAVNWQFDVGVRRDIGRKLGRLRQVIERSDDGTLLVRSAKGKTQVGKVRRKKLKS